MSARVAPIGLQVVGRDISTEEWPYNHTFLLIGASSL
jgi:hypothetical protein